MISTLVNNNFGNYCLLTFRTILTENIVFEIESASDSFVDNIFGPIWLIAQTFYIMINKLNDVSVSKTGDWRRHQRQD